MISTDINILSWNNFSDSLYTIMYDRTAIAYDPTFPDAPTNPSVVETSLTYFMKVMFRLCHDKTVTTCDM